MRKYSFQDIEILVDIANQLEDGIWTNEIRKELKRREQDLKNEKVCDLLINTEAR